MLIAVFVIAGLSRRCTAVPSTAGIRLCQSSLHTCRLHIWRGRIRIILNALAVLFASLCCLSVSYSLRFLLLKVKHCCDAARLRHSEA